MLAFSFNRQYDLAMSGACIWVHSRSRWVPGVSIMSMMFVYLPARARACVCVCVSRAEGGGRGSQRAAGREEE